MYGVYEISIVYKKSIIKEKNEYDLLRIKRKKSKNNKDFLFKIRNVERNNWIDFALYFYKKHVYDNKSFDF
jgi:hypothetical protein